MRPDQHLSWFKPEISCFHQRAPSRCTLFPRVTTGPHSINTTPPPQGETLLGQSADQVAELKERDADKVAAVLKAAHWQVGRCLNPRSMPSRPFSSTQRPQLRAVTRNPHLCPPHFL